MQNRQDRIAKRLKRLKTKTEKISDILQPKTEEYIDTGREDDVYSEKELLGHCDLATNKKKMALELNGRGVLAYSPNSKFLALGTNNGLLAAMNWAQRYPLFEMNVGDNIKCLSAMITSQGKGDILREKKHFNRIFFPRYLHTENMLACATQNVKIYDNVGTELHDIRKIYLPLALDYLPHFMLLTAASEKGFLTYLDITTGDIVAHTATHRGRLDTLTSNPTNGVCFTGHTSGTVSLWTPNESKPVAYMICHEFGGPISSLHVHPAGRQLATTAQDKRIRIWDLRKLGHDALHEVIVSDHIHQVAFSRTGLLACGMNRSFQIIDLAKGDGVLDFSLPSPLSQFRFCPAEDFLGVCMQNRFESYLIPGSTAEHFDSFAPNPYESKTMRQEREVKQLLHKVPSSWISLDIKHFKEKNIQQKQPAQSASKSRRRAPKKSMLDHLK